MVALPVKILQPRVQHRRIIAAIPISVDNENVRISLEIVLRCTGRIVTIFSLCCAIGLQWIALQSVAWTTMLVDYSKRVPLRQAIAQTLDGSHPCSLCHAVSTAKHSQKKSDVQATGGKIDLICSVYTFYLLPPLVLLRYPFNDFSFSDNRDSPLIPPPRALSS
jgi:hypothetical protein